MELDPVESLLAQLEPGAAPADLGRRVAENLAARPLGEGEIHYAQACTWHGALRVAEELRDTDLSQRLIARYAPLLQPQGAAWLPSRAHVDDRVFGIVPLEIARQTREQRYLDAGLRFADAQWQTTTADGISTEARYWIDDLFLIPALQVQAYRATGQGIYLERAALTMSAYLRRLQQPNGLFHHTQTSPVFWGRGNGWVAVGMTELLLDLPANHALRPQILGCFQHMFSALASYPDMTGGFRQLIDVRDSWLEMSGTAMFTFAMVSGLRHRWLEAERFLPIARDAWHCLADHVDADGNLNSVCPGTGEAYHHVGSDPEAQARYYLRRPRERGDLHGQAPLLWASAALLHGY